MRTRRLVCAKCAKSLQLCLTLCNPMDQSPPGSSVHGILQARILEWVAMPPPPGDLPHPGFEPESLILPALVGGFFNTSSTISLQCRRPGFNPWVGNIPWGRARQPTNSTLARESLWTEEPGRYSQQGCKNSDTTE